MLVFTAAFAQMQFISSQTVRIRVNIFNGPGGLATHLASVKKCDLVDYEKATSAMFHLENNIQGGSKDFFIVNSRFGGIFEFLIKITL